MTGTHLRSGPAAAPPAADPVPRHRLAPPPAGAPRPRGPDRAGDDRGPAGLPRLGDLRRWFPVDDFDFISRMFNAGSPRPSRPGPYAGHVMPAGDVPVLAQPTRSRRSTSGSRPPSWSPCRPCATSGSWCCCCALFGLRPGILPPLALYLVLRDLAAGRDLVGGGVNQLPLQVALFLGLAAHVSYLRTGRLRHAVAADAGCSPGSRSTRRPLLVYGVLGIVVALPASPPGRSPPVRRLWRTAAPASCSTPALGRLRGRGTSYVGLNFSVGRTQANNGRATPRCSVDHGLRRLRAGRDGRRSAAVASTFHQFSFAPARRRPGRRARSSCSRCWSARSARSRTPQRCVRWWLPAFFLASTCVLVLVTRAERRSSAARSASTTATRASSRRPPPWPWAARCCRSAARWRRRAARASELLDHPPPGRGADRGVSVLARGLLDQYATALAGTPTPARALLRPPAAATCGRPTPVPLVDRAVPATICGHRLPARTCRATLLRDVDVTRTDFVRDLHRPPRRSSTADGQVEPAVVPVTRRGRRGPHGCCGYRIGAARSPSRWTVRWSYGGWWVRIGYLGSGGQPGAGHGRGASYTTRRCSPACTRSTSRGGPVRRGADLGPGGRCDHVHRRRDGRATPVPRSEFHPVSFPDRTFPTLNAVRAIGALMVVLTHAAFNTGQINHGWIGAVLARLDFGVTLFFVLSGFLLSRPVLPHRARWAGLALDPPLSLEAGAAHPAALLGRGRGVAGPGPAERDAELARLGHPPDPHPALPARPAGAAR